MTLLLCMAYGLILYLLVRLLDRWAARREGRRHSITTLPQPGPPAHWPGCERKGCNCWTCGKHYLCPKGSHR